MSLPSFRFSSATDIRFGRDKAKRTASILECLARTLSTSQDQASVALEAQDVAETDLKDAAVTAANASSIKATPVLLEEAALSDIMNKAR